MPDALDRFEAARLACLLEVTARKPGNVHRFADFEDASYFDFVLSAGVISDRLRAGAATHATPGTIILDVVRGLSAVTQTNTYLGTTLLLVPLALTPVDNLRDGIADVLGALTIDDARHAYEAIRIARAGGLGSVGSADIAQEPMVTLLEAMRLAADRDLIAQQYASNFATIFDFALPQLEQRIATGEPLELSIIDLHLMLMSRFPDSLIARKCGLEVARDSAAKAAEVLAAGWPTTEMSHIAFTRLDAWLRADGHRRNPGTSADLVAATLYSALVKGLISPAREWRREFPTDAQCVLNI